jgi:Flp pilus assembly protein TadD
MPQFALKLLNSATAIQPLATTLAPDLMMTYIMLGNLQAAVKAMVPTTRSGGADEKNLSFLARLLLADGQRDEAERLLSQSRTLFKKIETAWLAVDFNNHSVAS